MTSIFKRTISFVLAMLMVMSLLPGVGHVHAHAEEGEQETTAVTVPVEETTAPAVEETVTQETVGELSPLDNIVDVQSAGAIMPLATTKNFADSTVADLGISATDASGNGGPVCSWNASGTNITGSLVGGKDSGGLRKYYYASDSTLTLTNNKSTEAELSFKFSVSFGNGGTVTVNGTDYTAAATDKPFSVTLAAGGQVTIKLAVPQKMQWGSLPAANGASITISDVKLVSQGSVTVDFAAAENGSYTVTDASGAAVTVPGSVSAKSTDRLTMTATPAAGYVFAGWYNVTTGTYLSADLSYTTLFEENATVKPLFALAADGVYGVGDAVFTDLTAAATAAASSTTKTVVLLKNATLTGSHTIPAGVVLLIPYDAAHTLNTADPESVTVDHSNTSSSNYVKYEKPSAFRTLTMASGASITVNGAISVNAMHESCVGGQIYGGQVLGKYGCIKMISGSSITLNNGANLYAWGYIWGDGTVTAKSGATVYEKMQVTDYRGGSNTSVIALRNGFGKTDGAFPFNQYYIQNVEVKEVLHEGAALMAHAAVNLSGETPVEAAVEFIGTTSAMFTVSGATITKEYHPETDRLSLTVNGDEKSYMEMNGMKLSMGTLSIDSANYTLPINGNIDITINAGTAVVNQELVLQPGVRLTVGAAAMLATNSNIYIMDLDQWGAFVFSGKRQQAVVYTPSLGGPSKRTINSDAVIDINGYGMPIGGIFTTAGGAQIISSGKTGMIEMGDAAPADSTVAQLTGGSDVKNINVTAAQLTNGNANKPFTATKGAAAGDIFSYCPECDSWHRETDECAPTTLPAVEITWIGANGADLGTEEFEMNTVPVYNGTPTKAQSGCTTYTFAGWSTEANGGGTKHAVGTALPAATADATYYAYFTEGTSHTKVVTDAKVAATCTTDGKTEGSHCEACGTVIVAQTTISATGHDMQKTADQVDATCEEDGKTAVYTCANNCGKTEGGAVIPATKHNMQQSAAKVDATCEKDGKEAVYTCANNCGKTEGGAVIPATGHDMQKTADQVDATCEADGKEAVYTCANNCGKTEGGAVIPATGHDMQKTADQVDATCEADGKTAVYTCANNCGKTEGGAVIPATGHDMQKTADQVDATCEADGKTAVYTCANNCGKTEGGAVIPATGHDMQKTADQVDATCEKDGKTAIYTCANNCGKTEGGAVIPATKHNMQQSAAKVDATCEKDGKEAVYTCANNCGKTEGGAVIPATGHDMQKTADQVGATCEGDGKTAIFTCANNCGKTEGGAVIPATGHDMQKTADQVDATCEADGKTAVYTCANNCGKTEGGDVIPATGHTSGASSIENKVDATCEDKGGYDEVTYCLICGVETSRNHVVTPAKGHTAGASVKENEVAATCGADGSYDTVIYCSVCGEELSRETTTVPATGAHVYATETERVEATCTVDGYVIMACGCGATEKTTLSAPGHTAGEAVEENKVPADCENDGSYDTVVYCSVCGAELSRVTSTIPALGHSEPVYTNNGDTHSVDYPCCDGLDVLSESHTYENGQCICGAKEPFTVGVVNSYGVADAITLSNPIAIPGQDYVTTISGTVGTSFGIWGVYNAEGEWIDPYFCCEFDGETNTLTVRGEYVDEGMVLNIGAWVTATYYLNGGYVNSGFDTSFVPDANGAFTWEWNCGDYPFSFWSYDFGTTHDGNFAFEREGYTLVGYNTAADGSGTMYGFEQKVAHTEDIVLYMIWECNHDTWQDATCTAPKTCTTCGKTEGEALGHSEPVYTNNGDTHSAVYPCCGEAYVTDEPHDFENEDHKCVCGMVEMVDYTVEVYYMDTEGNYPETPGKTMTFTVPYGTKVNHYDDVQTPGFVISGNLPQAIVTESFVMKVQMCRAAIQIQYRDEQDNILGRQLIYFEVTDTLRTDEEVAPARTGYTFVGWATEIGGDVVYGLDNLEYTNTSTYFVAVEVLYPVYELSTYTVTFTVLGQVYDTVTVTYGEKIALPETDPEVEGYRFNGWKNVPNSMPDNDLTIEADLVEQVTISYYRYNGDAYQYEYDYDVTVDKGAEVKLPYYYWNYSNTLGWDANDDGVVDYEYNETITADESLTLKPVLVPFYADVYLGAEDAVFVDAEGNPITHIYAENPYNNEITLTNHPTREGYTFLGWLVNGSEQLVYTNDKTGKLEVRLFFGDNYTATALWEINTHTVTFTVNGEYYDETVFEYGQSVTAPEFEIPAGHTFSGWTVPDTMPDADITLDATLTANTHTVTFTVNGEYYAEVEVKYGQSITAPEFVIPEGHSFSGWTVPGTMPDADITLDATLTVNTYTVTFTVNGEYYADAQVKYGQSVTAPEFEIPEGHSFSGWTVSDTMPAEDITLDAALTVNTYTVTFTVNGEYYADAQVKYGQIVTAPEYVIPEGHSFSGWTVPDTMPAKDITLDAALTVNVYELSIFIGDHVEENGVCYTEISLQVPYGALLKDYLVETPDLIANTDAQQGKYTFAYWHTYASNVALDTETATMPANYIRYYATYDYTGWYIEEGGKYFVDHYEAIAGWFCVNDKNELVTDGSGDWYYIDPYRPYTNTGVSRAPYPAEAINGITYAPDQESLDYGNTHYGYFIDEKEAWFIFDEDGKFQYAETGMVTYQDETRYAVNGMLPWHVGLVQIGEDYYYFIGDTEIGGNIMATGNVYMSRNNTDLDVVTSGVYTYGADGKLLKADGITDVNGTLYYYEDYQLMIGAGLIKIDEDYYYVRSNGALVVNSEYWVGDNKFGIVDGTYRFDENGKLVLPVYEYRNGVYAENGGLFYYVNGNRTYAGLIEWNGGWIYVRSNGQLAVGRYWTTKHNGVKPEGFYDFDENGMLIEQKNGIINENGTLYYYINNEKQYNSGVIQLNGNYYYVRSNGVVVAGQNYWITNVGTSGVVAKQYTFDANGVMQNPEFAVNVKEGVVDGYYYENGKIVYGAGLIEWNGDYYYVRSNGQVATGEYWITTTNGLKPQGKYNFGTDGKMILN